MRKRQVIGAERRRLEEDAMRSRNWKRWGPYLSERQWGTVREDYSESGDCWSYFPHDHARSRAYRWGEDGLLGICDRECRLCFAIALWNQRDPILKERLFGLTNSEGNHGEDVKECYFYVDSTPTHSYMKAVYKYPHAEFPYERLVAENRARSKDQPEFELEDTGVFDGGRYCDVAVEYAKASADDVLIKVTVSNRGPERTTLSVLPTVWFRNTWVWGCTYEGCWVKPRMMSMSADAVLADQVTLGRFWFIADPSNPKRADEWLFTDNETNNERLFGTASSARHVKDAFHRYVVKDEKAAVNPRNFGTKAAPHYRLSLDASAEAVLRFRLFEDEAQSKRAKHTKREATPAGAGSIASTAATSAAPMENAGVKFGDGSAPVISAEQAAAMTSEASIPVAPDAARKFGAAFDKVFSDRQREADEFYGTIVQPSVGVERRLIARQASAGLLWSKQYYHYAVREWLEGDPNMPPPPESRKHGRNRDWTHLFNRDVISMPDKWEYPWYAAWDLAFHAVAFAHIDPEFAKQQLVLMLREWYMHPNGEIPAYEFALGDVNPPVHAWACWRVYKMTGPRGERDVAFLERTFHKLMLNFTWWVNRKDVDGQQIFSGGFLGLDNIGVFDRNMPLPSGARLQQADGTAWMAFFCGTMLAIALELASHDPVYEDVASKFFEHYVAICHAMNTLGGDGLWDERTGFYYDKLLIHGEARPLEVRSLVGVIPLLAVEILEEPLLARLPGFRKRMVWFMNNRPDLARHISRRDAIASKTCGHYLLSIPSRSRLVRVLRYVLHDNEFLSPYGIRSLSRHHAEHPYVVHINGNEQRIAYTPGESDTGMFGGNSNWRGPVWFPLNYLLMEALQRYHHFYGRDVEVEFPTGSGNTMTLDRVAAEIGRRLVSLFVPGPDGRRPCNLDHRFAHADPHWRGLVPFHEYFHADTGKGLGASHQTGWTALVARCIEECSRHGGA